MSLALELDLDGKRRRVAWHEAGHGLVAWVLGGKPGPLSIRATRRWGGVCFSASLPRAPAELLASVDVAAPLLAWPVEVRAELEARLLFCVGGVAAVQLMPPLPPRPGETTGGYGCNDDVEVLLDRVRRRAGVQPLTGAECELLASGDDPDADPIQSDLERAFELALALVDDQGAAHHYVAAHIVMARRLLELEELKASRLSRLASALLAEKSVSAAAAAQLLAEHPRHRAPRITSVLPPELAAKRGAGRE